MAKDECVICGQPHPRCNAHKSGSDPVRPCMRWPRDMEKTCQLHGGNAPNARAAGAAARQAKAARADATAALGFELDGRVPDPMGVIEGMVAMEIATMQALSARVNSLHDVRYPSEHSIEQIRAEVVLLERSRDRVMKYVEVLMKHKPDGEAAATINLLTNLADRLAEHPSE